MPWFNTRLGPEKKKSIHLIYVLYIVYVIYIVYILYAYYISYILHIYFVKSEWYISRTSFTTYILETTSPMFLRMTSSGYKVRGCPVSIPGWILKKEKKNTS